MLDDGLHGSVSRSDSLETATRCSQTIGDGTGRSANPTYLFLVDLARARFLHQLALYFLNSSLASLTVIE